MWNPYEKTLQRRPDFMVEYKFRTHEEGGLKQRPIQGMRSDLHYDDEDIQKDGIYCIWPEFLDMDGKVIIDTNLPVPESGHAYMWIVFFDRMWDYHAKNATPGRKCWFMVGSRKIADATIIEQIGLIHQIDLPAKDLKNAT